MTPFVPDQYIVLALIFLLGLVIGMALMAGGKWKRRYREEVDLRRQDRHKFEALEAENRQLRKDSAEMDSLRGAAARDEARRRDPDERGPL